MTAYGATGPTSYDEAQAKAVISAALAQLPDVPTRFVTGCAYGVDTWFVELARKGLFPRVPITYAVPATEYHNPLYEKIWLPFDELISVASAGDASATYMARNDLIVLKSDVLLAFPPTPCEITRSGTWATVRRARRAGVPVHRHSLNGEPSCLI